MLSIQNLLSTLSHYHPVAIRAIVVLCIAMVNFVPTAVAADKPTTAAADKPTAVAADKLSDARADNSVVRIQELPSLQKSKPQNEFEFARLMYEGGYEWPRWQADWPEAETHFSQGLKRLTRLDVSTSSRVLSLTDPNLFDFPWMYVVEVGYWSLSFEERDNLREYLLRGGFLMVDDFHGVREWKNFELIMRSVFPAKRFVDLNNASVIFDVHFDVKERMQIPGIRSIMNGRTWEKGGVNPSWLGIVDDDNRVMVAINFNQDIGDAWEHADDAIYPEPYTALAYRIGVNYVIYAMTH